MCACVGDLDELVNDRRSERPNDFRSNVNGFKTNAIENKRRFL